MQRLLNRLSGFFPAVLGAALPVVFIPIASDSYILPRASIVIGGACLGIGVALVAGINGRLDGLRWPLAAAAGAALLAFAFSISWPLSVAGSYTRYESLPVRLGYLGLLVSAVWLLRDRVTRDWLVAGFVFGSCVASLEGVWQWASHAPFRPDGNLGNANLLAALVAMALPLALQRALRNDAYLLAWAAAIVVLGAGIYVTTSRSGALGAIAGMLTIGVLAVRGRAVFVAASAWVGAVGAAILVIQLSPLHALNDDPAALRLHLWQDGLRLVAARPLTGWGEEATGLSFGHFLSRDYASLVTFDRVHSGPLDVAATQGVVGLAALGWVLAVVAIAAWRRRADRDVAGLAGALIGYSVWVFFNFDWAPVTGVFWLLAGTLWSATHPLAGPPRQVGRVALWRPVVAIGLVIVAVVLAVLPVMADVWYLRGRADLAVRVDPLQAQYHWSLGDGLIAQGNVAGGVAELRRAADLGETEPDLYVELGDREALLGNRTQARRDYERALEIDPYFTPASQHLAALGSR